MGRLYSQIGTGAGDSTLGRQAPEETTAGLWVGADRGKTNPHKEGEGSEGGRLCCGLWAPLRGTSSLLAVGISSCHPLTFCVVAGLCPLHGHTMGLCWLAPS